MAASLHALLEGVLDYAGLFPPARLPLDEAFRSYTRLRQDPDAWMLGRFVCPVAQLAALPPLLDELPAESPPLALAVVGRAGKDLHDSLAGISIDLDLLEEFQR